MACCRKECINSLANVLEHVGLALMIGGMLALGAFVAPALFHNFPFSEAGRVMTMIFRRYDVVIAISLALVVMGETVRLALNGFSRSLAVRLRYVTVVLLIVLTLFSQLAIHPKMEAYQKAGVTRGVGQEGIAFDQLHKQSEGLYKAELVIGLVVLVLVSL